MTEPRYTDQAIADMFRTASQPNETVSPDIEEALFQQAQWQAQLNTRQHQPASKFQFWYKPLTLAASFMLMVSIAMNVVLLSDSNSFVDDGVFEEGLASAENAERYSDTIATPLAQTPPPSQIQAMSAPVAQSSFAKPAAEMAAKSVARPLLDEQVEEVVVTGARAERDEPTFTEEQLQQIEYIIELLDDGELEQAQQHLDQLLQSRQALQ